MHDQPTIHKLTQAAQYELFHQHFGHPGQQTMSILHLHVNDVPPLHGNSFYKCLSCVHTKSRHRSYNKKPTKPIPLTTKKDIKQGINILPGQHFNVDFGFLHGTDFATTDTQGSLITSIDGYQSYLLIIDKCSRYLWIFLAKTKTLPIDIVKNFLQQHGSPHTKYRTIWTDKGGELWGSYSFQEMVLKLQYLLEPTAPDAPSNMG